MRVLLAAIALAASAAAQTPRSPDLAAQRAAMKKLSFLVGKWAGEARVGQTVMEQTEEAQFRLDGLLLTIEGIGRNKADGKLALQAYGLLSYDDATGTYHMRAFNDGRFLETEVKLLDEGKGMTWAFTAGSIKTSSVMRISDSGAWTEQTEIIIGTQPPRKYIEVSVSPVK